MLIHVLGSKGWIGSSLVQYFEKHGFTVNQVHRENINNWKDLTAKEIMTTDPITIISSASISETTDLMECNSKKPITAIPVISKNNKILGIVRLHDLIQTGFV